ncbi:hypothetical protein AAVH_33729, partial [Aphelenchoides avenae]
ATCGFVLVRLFEDDDSIIVARPNNRPLEMLFHRFNNAFVFRLAINFRQMDLPLLHYLRANASDLQCRIRALHIDGAEERIDYDLIGFLGLILKPQVYEVSLRGELHEDYATLFTHKALRDDVKHLVFN